MKKISFNPYVIVYTDAIEIYDVYFIIIDEKNMTIELCDERGFAIGGIHYEKCKNVGFLKYDERERLTNEVGSIVEDGKIVL